jgi:DNA-binding response OmpR family regulator
MAKILLADDDIDLAEAVQNWLGGEKHAVEVVYDGQEALERMRVYKYDLAILDWQMPGLPGIKVCGKFRESGGKTPILILTSRAQVEDKEAGLDSGADDYLTKPFEMRELSARVRALLRRPPSEVTSNVLKAGHLSLDRQTHEVKRGDVVINLLPKEFALLEFLMRYPNEVFSLETLLNRVWPSDSDSSPDTVRVHLTHLRNKLQPKGGPQIKTVYGVGYKLELTD